MKLQKAKSRNVSAANSSEKSALIICNGNLCKSLIKRFMRPGKQFIIIAADGASEFLYEHKIIPNYIAGDLDSITSRTRQYFSRREVKIIRIVDQNRNDFEKCLMVALRQKIGKIAVIGLAGKRFDHTLNNLSVLKKYYRRADIRCYEKGQEYFFIKKKIEFECKTGDTISLLALPKASGITTRGLKYPLNNGTLEFGIFEGALNIAIRKFVSIQLKRGTLLVCKKSEV